MPIFYLLSIFFSIDALIMLLINLVFLWRFEDLFITTLGSTFTMLFGDLKDFISAKDEFSRGVKSGPILEKWVILSLKR